MAKVLVLKKLHFSKFIFSCGLIPLFGRALAEFKFSGSSTIRSDTVVGLKQGTSK